MKLSQNFYLSEFLKSNTATRRGIKNIPTERHIEQMVKLCDNILQPLRNMLGYAVNISSGYRSKALNEAIGGSLTSQHSKGQAADLDNDVYSGSNAEIFHAIKDNLDFDQLIWEFGDDNEPAWVHVSYVSHRRNRNQILVAYKEEGKTRYRHYD